MNKVSIFSKSIYLLLMALLVSFVPLQDNYPKNYFINPLNISMHLAGTFGEIRSNHFHTGIDIKTRGEEGLVVHAAADGYISRIAVSPYGYGNALYITHPNGFVTLYGHLSRYYTKIAVAVKIRQYAVEKFAVEFYPDANEIPVKKGDTVAFTGSTGSVEGPHLHFEIRKADNEDPLNPFLFGYKCADREAPIIKGVAIYPLDDSASVNGSHRPLYFQTYKYNNDYRLKMDSVISANGKIGIGINTFDIEDTDGNHNGVYSILLTDNNDTIYQSKMNELSFSTSHYVNGHVDYPEYIRNGATFEYSFLQDNDKLNIYSRLKSRGWINCKSENIHRLQYSVSDFNGNKTSLFFALNSTEIPIAVIKDSTKYQGFIYWKNAFEYHAAKMSIEIPAGAVFKNMPFHITVDSSNKRSISYEYNIEDRYTPLNTSFTLRIKPVAQLSDSLKKKVVMVCIDAKRCLTGTWENGYYVANPRVFGRYALRLDVTKPIITPLNVHNGKDMSKDKSINFEISDNISGIGSFNGYVDGKWILMEYYPKKNLIYYTFDEHVPPGKHHFLLRVSDAVGNTDTYGFDFIR